MSVCFLSFSWLLCRLSLDWKRLTFCLSRTRKHTHTTAHTLMLCLILSESFNISHHMGILQCHPLFYWHASIWEELLPTSCLLSLAGPSSAGPPEHKHLSSLSSDTERGSGYDTRMKPRQRYSCGFWLREAAEATGSCSESESQSLQNIPRRYLYQISLKTMKPFFNYLLRRQYRDLNSNKL